ncbi:hypothetical protein Z968_02240 [Clostridium novyi A str. 4552]|uniref:WYL domain-containing protein n=2 Tax=Clostridium novyi TaxID=1542 RepID=A0A0A0IBD8_CLONO|nr:hypothetical protein Z968_02240 [Clostridium novyi A str. 4552]
MYGEKYTKVNRVLAIYEKFTRGDVVNKKQLSKIFGVSEKTIQRDIQDIGAYLDNYKKLTGNLINIKYIRDKNGYYLNGKDNDILNKEDALAICKILLESRAFCKEEIHHLINSILNQIDSTQRKYVNDLIVNELFNFVSLKHNDTLLSKIWDLSEFIRLRQVININYIKVDGVEVKRTLKPLAIIFSEYYFYLIAYFEDVHFDNPTVFRIDRITNYKVNGKKFNIPECQRFKDGEFRNRIQFMYSGELITVKFKFWGSSIEAVLDRLPTAKVIKEQDNKYLIEAEVYGRGILMWIMSQMQFIEVIEPIELREEIKKIIGEMTKNYI